MKLSVPSLDERTSQSATVAFRVENFFVEKYELARVQKMAPNGAVLTRCGVDRRDTEQGGEVRSLTPATERKTCLSIRACQREYLFRAPCSCWKSRENAPGRQLRRATRPRPQFFAREGFCALCRAHRTRLPPPHPPYVAPHARGVGPSPRPKRARAPVTSRFLLSLPPSPARKSPKNKAPSRFKVLGIPSRTGLPEISRGKGRRKSEPAEPARRGARRRG